MAVRKKRPKILFKKFLQDNQKILNEFDNGDAEKYTRDSWMMKSCPPAEEDEETLRQESESF